jgi:hypothetical protein
MRHAVRNEARDMAFCPNCGTNNPDPAEMCAACGHGLTPSQKARFKGTIMMSGVQLPAVKPAVKAAVSPVADAPVAAAPASAKPFAKTMLGAAISAPMSSALGAFSDAADDGPADDPSAPAKADNSAPPAKADDSAPPAKADNSAPPAKADDPAFARTMEAKPVQLPPAAQAEPQRGDRGRGAAPEASLEPGSAWAPASGGQRTAAAREAYRDSDVSLPPQKGSAGKAIAFGCAGALAVAALGTLAIYFFARQAFSELVHSSESTATAGWHQSLGQAITQVAEQCTQDCSAAAVYFHPQKQEALLPEAKLLTPARAARLGPATSAVAQMLADTDDGALATQLNLDPNRCVEVALDNAKAVGCSVIDAAGNESLRIVHLSGIGSL